MKELFKKTIFVLTLMIFASFSIQSQTGAAIDLGNTDSYVDLGAPIFSTTSGTQPYTFEVWLKPISTGNPHTIVCQYLQGDANRVALYLADNGNLHLWWGSGVEVVGTVSLIDGDWHHVAFSKDTDGTTKLYTDGALVGQAVTTIHPYVNNNTWLGAQGWAGVSTEYYGAMDEVRIWNKVLSETEIQNSMNCELTGAEDDLLVYYKFNEGTAGQNNAGLTNVTDASVNGNNGTLMNFILDGSTSNWVEPGAVTSGETCSTVFSMPLENWSIIVGILLIVSFIVIRFRKAIF